jgi:glycerophosphoryl diester phosphodiesterase
MVRDKLTYNLFQSRSVRFIGGFLCILIIFCTINSCKKDVPIVDNLYNGNVIILGHRGMGELYKYPGNTWESISPAVEIGVDGCEVDIQMTKDSVLVLCHDTYLSDKTNCDSTIYSHNWSEISGCTYYSSMDNIYLISVDNLFSRLPDLQSKYFSFDVKIADAVPDQAAYFGTFGRAIKTICEKYNMTEHVFVEGQKYLLTAFREAGLQNKLFINSGVDIYTSSQQAQEMGAYGVACSAKSVTKEDVKAAHDKGLYVMMWGMQTNAENKEAISKNPDIVQTDKPIEMLKMFDRYKK